MLRPLITLCLAFALLSGHILQAASLNQHPGQVIYQKLCLECHGDRGQGVSGKYDEPLIGDRPLEALARKIDRTMPEENPDLCTGEDAKAVAAYIYDAFYSPAAQARISPAKKDLTRLTIPQYRTSVMDLIGRFRMGAGHDRPISQEAGLKAVYSGFALPPPDPPLPEQVHFEKLVKTSPDQQLILHAWADFYVAQAKREEENRQRALEKSKAKTKEKPAPYRFEKVEPRIAFPFGTTSPDDEKMFTDEFKCRWEGSVLARDTGMYEFIIKSENGFRLWVNDDQKALIDGWVSSGPEVREEKKSIFLLGGRAYRLILEHFKFKEASASIELWWKPPHGNLEIIPPHAFRQDRPHPAMVVSTTFPADDRSVGYERGSSISKAWDQATTEAAIATAEHVEAHLDRLALTKPGTEDRVEKLKQFATTFAGTAFRRPLNQEQKDFYIESHFKSAKSPEQAVKRIVLLALKSPRFLYPDILENDHPDDYDIASRLALALWDSIPDKKLFQAAADKKLQTPDQVRSQALRMISDPRAKTKLHGFFHHWLELEHAENTSKDPKAFPGFNVEVLADLRHSLLHFIDQVVWSQQSDYRELLQADYLLLNDRLAKFYGKKITGTDFQRIAFDPKQRAGVVTHPYLLSSLAYSKQTSPIHRGVFLTRNIVGISLKSPPIAVAFDESHFNPAFTMREKITELTRNSSCMSCHSTINPLGFSLENFDAIGRWRTQDNKKPVNPVSEFATEDGQTILLTGPRDIVNYVVDNPAGHRAFIRHLFHHTVKQQIPAYGPDVLDTLQHHFASSGCNIQKLLIEISIIAALSGVE
jgi:hypothetical protein